MRLGCDLRRSGNENVVPQSVRFSGSATTAIAALRLGRRALVIEKDPQYAELSRQRIAAELSSSTLAAYRAGQLPLLR